MFAQFGVFERPFDVGAAACFDVVGEVTDGAVILFGVAHEFVEVGLEHGGVEASGVDVGHGGVGEDQFARVDRHADAAVVDGAFGGAEVGAVGDGDFVSEPGVDDDVMMLSGFLVEVVALQGHLVVVGFRCFDDDVALDFLEDVHDVLFFVVRYSLFRYIVIRRGIRWRLRRGSCGSCGGRVGRLGGVLV